MKVKDPVCGMTIDSERAAAKGTYDGETVYFCAVGCRTEFERRRSAGVQKAR
ncbi:MAG TPA: YHS domain-containing protein [Thermoplasmata archaeon]|nr:YHS domain-containing protein [Thermoplasmata archaeon]